MSTLKPVMFWDDVPEAVEKWSAACEEPAGMIRRSMLGLRTCADFSLYWNPVEKKAGVFARLAFDPDELELVKSSAAQADCVDELRRLTVDDLTYGPWVKVAYSRPARNLGVNLNFFPGTYTNGMPNSPSPLAATLTGGLLGAGLGYGAGRIGEEFLPESFTRGNLSRSLALMGGAAGATPGALWSLSAASRGNSLTDGGDFDAPVGSAPRVDAQDMAPIKTSASRYDDVVRGLAKQAFATFGRPYPPPTSSPSAVNTNRLGQTLWSSGADKGLTMTTAATMDAASRMPDPRSRPGMVTPHQTGLLGVAMGAAGGGIGGYIAGHAVGKTLGALTGLPPSAQTTLARTGLAVGIVRSTLPKLFS